MATAFFNLSMTEEERKELLELVKNDDKWVSKIKDIKGYFGFNLTPHFVSPGVPPWAEPLPYTLDIGKRVKVKSPHTWASWEGKISQHYICGDDCSGYYGKHKYEIVKDNGERFSVLTSDCEIL